MPTHANKGKKTAPKKKTTPKRRMSAATRDDIYGVLSRAKFRVSESGKRVSYTARGEKGPRVVAAFPRTVAAARALVKRARPNYREGRAGGGMEASFAAYARARKPRRSIPAHSRVPAAPRARVEIRDALERAGFRLLGTGKSVSYTARGEKGPRVIAPFPKTLTAARALIKRAKAGSRASAAAPRRRNPAIRDGFTRVDTVMVRHKPFMDIYRGPPIPKHRGMYPYYGVVRSTGEVTETMRVRAALGPVELLGAAEIMAQDAGLLKRPEKERGTRKRRGRIPAGVSTDVYLESQATALFDRKLPAYEDPGKYFLSNPRLPMGATKHATAYVVMWNRGSIERQKVADIYRSRKGGYFVIYTVGSLPHTIIDVERRTASGARDEVHEYLETEVPEMLKTSSGQMRAIKIIPAKGEKVPDAKLKRNGRTECGYHGVPMIRGECVVCAYEADVR